MSLVEMKEEVKDSSAIS